MPKLPQIAVIACGGFLKTKRVMETNKLKIGNLFIEEHSEQIIEVIGLTEKEITFSGKFPYKWQAKPIYLTKDWLIKFGYSFQPWGCVKENTPLIRFSLNPKEKYWVELGNGFKIELPYVHTLQNLTSLIGDELTYED